jgi:hypothetical protein
MNLRATFLLLLLAILFYEHANTDSSYAENSPTLNMAHETDSIASNESILSGTAVNFSTDDDVSVPPCSFTDPECLNCTRWNDGNSSNVSFGRCVLFGPTSIHPSNGPVVGRLVVTLYGVFFGEDGSEKVGLNGLIAWKNIANALHTFRIPALARHLGIHFPTKGFR